MHRLYPAGVIYYYHWKGKTPNTNVIKILILIVKTHVDIPKENQKELFVRISNSTKKNEIYAQDILYM